MTSAVKTSRHGHARGFTLLEIVVVLTLAAVIMGGALGFIVFSSGERVLRNASGEIEVLAKRARATAILQQTPYAIEFREGIVKLMPLAAAGRTERLKVGGRRVLDEPVDDVGGERWEYALEGGMQISVLRWNASEWLATRKDTVHVWRFDPNGICEPITIRLALEDGWVEDSYHPLTASIRETQMEAR